MTELSRREFIKLAVAAGMVALFPRALTTRKPGIIKANDATITLSEIHGRWIDLSPTVCTPVIFVPRGHASPKELENGIYGCGVIETEYAEVQ